MRVCLQLDKLVYLVDERLPVTLEESEDGSDMDDGSSGGYEDDEVCLGCIALICSLQ